MSVTFSESGWLHECNNKTKETMYKQLFTAYGLLTLLITLGSCSSDETLATERTDILFETGVTQRVMNTTWDAGDKIGVFMLKNGTGLDASGIVGGGDNVSYTTLSGNGTFTPTAGGLKYPADGTKVDFIAYYPYAGTLDNYTYAVDLTDQRRPSTIDLLYANDAKGFSQSSNIVRLNFRHQLVRVELTIKSKDNKQLTGVKVDLNNQPLRATFDLNTGTFTQIAADRGTIAMNATSAGTLLTATAFILPGQRDITVTITATDGTTKQITLEANKNLKQGDKYTKKISVTNLGSTETPAPTYTHWTETPTITAQQLKDYKYISHYFSDNGKQVRSYSMLYDTQLKMAYWVAYPLCNYYTAKNVKRTNAWAYDPSLSSEEQATMKRGLAGYDRGHQIPSADRLVTREANEQTFYYTNMTPQIGRGMNQNIWQKLETAVRGWSSNIDTLYVVTGAMPTTPENTTISYTQDNDGKQIAVPKYYFKALCRINRATGEAYTIAFKLENKAYPNNEPYMNHTLSVAELERMTGFVFFPMIREQDKQAYDKSKWN
ncbi:fimbrillin family protein [Alloprevotella tannerae]|uniref:fimbrillin family protein n=1 Tax=Alloprevotella tannerae TaxID=76122 RepID=UPI0028E5F08E|nr:fimbrillin family protein [Alloprevotella tannerae]